MLGSLALNNASNQQAIRERGMKLILEAMGQHEVDAGVQKESCYALKNLVSESAENAAAIAEQGGIKAIIEAMSKHGPMMECRSIAARDCRESVRQTQG